MCEFFNPSEGNAQRKLKSQADNTFVEDAEELSEDTSEQTENNFVQDAEDLSEDTSEQAEYTFVEDAEGCKNFEIKTFLFLFLVFEKIKNK